MAVSRMSTGVAGCTAQRSTAAGTPESAHNAAALAWLERASQARAGTIAHNRLENGIRHVRDGSCSSASRPPESFNPSGLQVEAVQAHPAPPETAGQMDPGRSEQAPQIHRQTAASGELSRRNEVASFRQGLNWPQLDPRGLTPPAEAMQLTEFSRQTGFTLRPGRPVPRAGHDRANLPRRLDDPAVAADQVASAAGWPSAHVHPSVGSFLHDNSVVPRARPAKKG